MGALHAGHISLITISKKKTDVSVCSIFVNPTQFNDPKDFQKYPATLDKDIALLERAGVDILFLPEVAELYPGGTTGLETYDLGRLETLLEGKYRPGHFQGVCQVMRRLLDIVRPDHLFMGQKDYQQCMVVQRLLTLRGMDTQLHRCPIVREADGLAMSSRNLRLTPEQRTKATAIYQALGMLATNALATDGLASDALTSDVLIRRAEEMLKQADFQVDYIAIADAETLEPEMDKAGSVSGGIALIAAFQGEVRLIDNMIL